MPLDYYDILGLSRDASTGEIKKAFRQQARLLHPDVNDSPDAVNEFQRLQQAYAVLIDPEKRAQYDQGEELIVQIVRHTPDASYFRRRAWNTFAKYDPEYGYVDTDYAHYARFNTIVGIVTLLFACTFLIDFIFSSEQLGLQVLSVKNKGLETGKTDDLSYVIVETEAGSFEKDSEAMELNPGDQIDLKSSLIYGFNQYKKSNEAEYRRVTVAPIIIYVLAVFVYIASLNAVFNKKRPERKFNAAIIAAFFSVMLLIFALAI